jgi:hypothetical protein
LAKLFVVLERFLFSLYQKENHMKKQKNGGGYLLTNRPEWDPIHFKGKGENPVGINEG